MQFTFTEINGDQPIVIWLVEKVKEQALRAHGIEIEVTIIAPATQAEE